MKIKFYILIGMVACFSSCGPNFNNDPRPTATPCDNTTAPLTVALDWGGTFYDCTSATFGSGNRLPPNATSANYMGYASATGGASSLSTPLSYLCIIQINNGQPADNPNAACAGPGMASWTWAKSGPTQEIYRYKNAPTKIAIDYYDICGQCDPSSPKSVRPHFIGMAVLPITAQPTALIKMTTQTDYTSTNCQ